KYQEEAGATWSDWKSAFGVLTSNIAIVPDTAWRDTPMFHLFALGTDYGLYYQNQLVSGVDFISFWQSRGGILTSDPTAVWNEAGHLDVFGRGNDGAVWHLQSIINRPDYPLDWLEEEGIWQPWASLAGRIIGNVAVGLNADGRLKLFVRGTDNAVWVRSQQGLDNW